MSSFQILQQYLAAGQSITLPTLYDVSNDVPSQRAALENFYHAANGSGWALDGFIPNVLGALAAAPPALLQLFTDPNTTAAQKESLYLQSIYSDSSSGISPSLKLALYSVGLAKHRWLTPNTSYCTWYVIFLIRNLIWHTQAWQHEARPATLCSDR